jgi:hypothetical protein
MNTEATPEAEMLANQLQKWVSRGQVRNVRLRPAYAHPAIPLGQIAIAEVISRNGDSAFFAETGFVLPGRGFIPYDHVKSAAMPARTGARGGSRRDEFDHVQFGLQDGSSTLLTSIEQAVFPLLTFFEWLIGQREARGSAPAAALPTPEAPTASPRPRPRPRLPKPH